MKANSIKTNLKMMDKRKPLSNISGCFRQRQWSGGRTVGCRSRSCRFDYHPARPKLYAVVHSLCWFYSPVLKNLYRVLVARVLRTELGLKIRVRAIR